MTDQTRPEPMTEADYRAAMHKQAVRQSAELEKIRDATEQLRDLFFRFLKDWTEKNA